MFKIATWNVNSIKVRLPHVLDWLSENQLDVLAIQETKSTDENFPYQVFRDLGYHVVHAGQKTYNGVAVISKKPIELVSNQLLPDDPQQRYLECLIDGYRIINVYVPNGQSVESDKYPYKLAWLAALEARIANYQDEPVVLLGDFNIAPADADIYDVKRWEGQVLCTAPERAALQAILDCGLVDSFRLFEQADKSFSWWDYRQLGFQFNKGLRIDLILIASQLITQATACMIDKAPRKLERPSDHAPVILTFDL